jgi:hypothetical protein
MGWLKLQIKSYNQPVPEFFEEWYDINTGDTHTFTATFADTIVFDSTSNLHNSLHGAGVQMTIQVEAERTADKPEITAMFTSGTIVDLYDFRSHGSNEPNGWASRIQTCYEPSCSREAGEIYHILIDTQVDTIQFFPDPYYDDFDALRSQWIMGIMNR